ncbi:class I SAM-dependent methyltransferase [Siminovitchia sp. 179-K 8D1 HS]|uniref:class I SAM-dependent methyltransferase n=1 Tax=Siminovitchia sp. 179-K 8D1 HS TaxID=3142385 RepID=UPI0039A0291E
MFESIKENFKEPHGIIGKIAGKIMELENRDLNEWAVHLLNIKPGEHVLEIGYRPGYGIAYLLNRHEEVVVDGIDVSEDMKELASKKLKEEITEQKVNLFVGDIEEKRLPSNRYDKVLSVNNYTLWDEQLDILANIYKAMVNCYYNAAEAGRCSTWQNKKIW